MLRSQPQFEQTLVLVKFFPCRGVVQLADLTQDLIPDICRNLVVRVLHPSLDGLLDMKKADEHMTIKMMLGHEGQDAIDLCEMVQPSSSSVDGPLYDK